MDYRKELLLASAARLYSLGVELEAARARLKALVEQGTAYDSDEMQEAYRNFRELQHQWQVLERQYLALRDEITRGSASPDGSKL